VFKIRRASVARLGELLQTSGFAQASTIADFGCGSRASSAPLGRRQKENAGLVVPCWPDWPSCVSPPACPIAATPAVAASMASFCQFGRQQEALETHPRLRLTRRQCAVEAGVCFGFTAPGSEAEEVAKEAEASRSGPSRYSIQLRELRSRAVLVRSPAPSEGHEAESSCEQPEFGLRAMHSSTELTARTGEQTSRG